VGTEVDWFEAITGFQETTYKQTRAQLFVEDGRLHSRVNKKSYGIGELELVSLDDLRQRAKPEHGRLKVSVVTGDVGTMHCRTENAGALFQVASQFNLLEMVGPYVTPEHGVTRYQDDHTQGPACAIAAGAATIYRNYFAPVEGGFGQTADVQLDGLADLGESLSSAIKIPVGHLWEMQNGYALGTETGLNAIAQHLDSITADEIDVLRGKLRIGLHHDVEVTAAQGTDRHKVSQAFCSALPIAYGSCHPMFWQPLAKLVLQAAYEATMWAGVLNSRRGGSNVIYLTLLGGGAFGNPEEWIYAAVRRALTLFSNCDLDVRIVSYGSSPEGIKEIVEEYS
jgi:hypothetical protein